jgi:hypothetical protein
MRLQWLSVLGFVPFVLQAQIRSLKYQNRNAWRIESPELRVTILEGGGHIAEIVLKAKGDLNPLWLQDRPTMEPMEYVPERHEKIYGGGPVAKLMSGLMGHNLCFPYWGNPSDSEYKAGMSFHGETGVVRWKKLDYRQQNGETQLKVAADLPESQTRFTRTITLVTGAPVVYFENLAENLTALDRPIGWCEHVTIGPPFLKKAVTLFDASLTRGRAIGDTGRDEFRWPEGQAETRVDLRTVRDVERSGFVNNFLVDPSKEFAYFTAANPEARLLVGYLFPRKEFPWLNIWEANQPPSDTQPGLLTRGLEFSNTPTHGSLKALIAVPTLWEVPAYEWLNARSILVKRFCAFSAELPEGFRGVQDVKVGDRSLEIIERDRTRVVKMAFDVARLR